MTLNIPQTQELWGFSLYKSYTHFFVDNVYILVDNSVQSMDNLCITPESVEKPPDFNNP